jgi:hypothetical protein
MMWWLFHGAGLPKHNLPCFRSGHSLVSWSICPSSLPQTITLGLHSKAAHKGPLDCGLRLFKHAGCVVVFTETPNSTAAFERSCPKAKSSAKSSCAGDRPTVVAASNLLRNKDIIKRNQNAFC